MSYPGNVQGRDEQEHLPASKNQKAQLSEEKQTRTRASKGHPSHLSRGTCILSAWEKDREKLLRDLGGIDRGYRNEERIRQIEQAIESIRQAQYEDERGPSG